MYFKKTNVIKIRTLIPLLAILFCINAVVLKAQEIMAQKDYLIALTPNWNGERFEDGRPKVSDEILNRIKSLSLEEAWSVLRNNGYKNQFSGEWKIIHSNRPMVGRALTAQYMPKRKAVREALEKKGAEKGYIGDMVSWPIDLLQEGDLYIADSYGKINEGPIIGDNLGTSIYAKSKNGVVINGSLRDLEGLEDIDGFNAFVKGWHPSYQMEMMLTGINTLVRIGDVTVIPGDVVLAKRGGVIFIPAHLAEEVVITGEFTALKDEFGHFCLRQGYYTPGEIDGRWTAEIKNEFLNWLDENPSKIKMTRKQLDDFLKERTW